MVRLLETFFRRWWLYLVPFLLLCGLGAYTVTSKPVTYRSVGKIFVQNDTVITRVEGDSSNFGWDTPAAATAKQINSQLQTEVFLKNVATRSGLEQAITAGFVTIDKLRSWIAVYSSGPNVVNVFVTAEDPVAAQRISQSTVDAFIQGVLDASVADSQTAITYYDSLLKSYESDVVTAREELARYLAAHPAPGFGASRPDEQIIEVSRLNAVVDQAEKRYDEVFSKREEARLETEQTKANLGQQLRLVDAPQVPFAPLAGKKAMLMGFGMFAAMGLFLVVAFVAVAATLDRSLRFPAELRAVLNADLLANIGETKVMRQKRAKGRKAPAEEPLERSRLAPTTAAQRSARRTTPRRPAPAPEPAAAPAPAAAAPVPSAPVARDSAGHERRPPDRRPPARRPAVAGRPDTVATPSAAPHADRARPAERPPQTDERRVNLPPLAPTAAGDEANGWSRGRRREAEPAPAESNGATGDSNGWPPRRRGGNVPHAS